MDPRPERGCRFGDGQRLVGALVKAVAVGAFARSAFEQFETSNVGGSTNQDRDGVVTSMEEVEIAAEGAGHDHAAAHAEDDPAGDGIVRRKSRGEADHGPLRDACDVVAGSRPAFGRVAVMGQMRCHASPACFLRFLARYVYVPLGRSDGR